MGACIPKVLVSPAASATIINGLDPPIEPIEIMIGIRARIRSGIPWVTGIRANIPESLIARIGTKHSIPDGCKVGECYVQAVR